MRALDYFNRDYEWTLKDYSRGETFSFSLDEIIESDIDLVKRNPQLFYKNLLKKNNWLYNIDWLDTFRYFDV